jgi:hypothetical protein
MVSFTHQLLYPQGKNSQYPLDRRLGELQNWSGHGGEEKESHIPAPANNWILVIQPFALLQY